MSTECHQDNSLKIGKLYIEIKSKALHYRLSLIIPENSSFIYLTSNE